MAEKKKRIGEIGERAAIEEIAKIIGSGMSSPTYRNGQKSKKNKKFQFPLQSLFKTVVGIGDDCAAISFGKYYLLVTTDMIYEKTHVPRGATPRQIGWFAAAINLSDIAAKGGTPIGLVFSMGIPPDYPVASLKQIVKGMKDCAQKFGVDIVGGDTKENDGLTIAGTAFGIVEKKNFMVRCGARSGDLVAVTGELGSAAAGYYAYSKDATYSKRSAYSEGATNCIRNCAAGCAPSAAGDETNGNRRRKALKGINPARLLLERVPAIKEGVLLGKSGAATACMDTSDGLAYSIDQLSEAGKVSFDIFADTLPISREARTVSRALDININDLALYYGGDYQLLATIKREKFGALAKKMADAGIRFTAIGKVKKGGENRLITTKGATKLRKSGFEHFTKRPKTEESDEGIEYIG